MKNKFLKIFAAILLAAACLTAVFLSGCQSTYDWVVSTINAHYYGEVGTEPYGGDIKKFVRDNLDEYSAYYTPEEYAAVNASNSGSKSGVGVSYGFLLQGVHPYGGSGIYISRVVGNSPAALAGVKAGEFALAGVNTDGTRVDFVSDRAFTDYLNAKGDGERFTLVTDRGSYELAKSAYTASYAYMYTATDTYTVTYDGKQPRLVETAGGFEGLPEHAAYLKLDQFYGNATAETATLIEKFNGLGCNSLILDLRSNGGGYVDVMSEIAEIFVGELENYNRVSMTARYKGGNTQSFYVGNKLLKQKRLPAGTGVSVLANNYTASASEALIGVLVDNGVIGYPDIYVSDYSEAYLNFSGTAAKNCRTYGKGIMQTTYTRANGEALKLTTAQIYWPGGTTSIHGTGVGVSNDCKALPAEWEVTYNDEQLSLAISMIYGA